MFDGEGIAAASKVIIAVGQRLDKDLARADTGVVLVLRDLIILIQHEFVTVHVTYSDTRFRFNSRAGICFFDGNHNGITGAENDLCRIHGDLNVLYRLVGRGVVGDKLGLIGVGIVLHIADLLRIVHPIPLAGGVGGRVGQRNGAERRPKFGSYAGGSHAGGEGLRRLGRGDAVPYDLRGDGQGTCAAVPQKCLLHTALAVRNLDSRTLMQQCTLRCVDKANGILGQVTDRLTRLEAEIHCGNICGIGNRIIDIVLRCKHLHITQFSIRIFCTVHSNSPTLSRFFLYFFTICNGITVQNKISHRWLIPLSITVTIILYKIQNIQINSKNHRCCFSYC